MTKTFIDELEDIVEIVSDWSVEVVRDAVQKLSTDGRPFMMDKKSTRQQLDEYLMLINSPDPVAACVMYIDQMAETVAGHLLASNIPPNEIVAIHPYDIAARHLIIWSAEMETLLQKEQARVARTLPPETAYPA